jgi:ATP-dependent Clp protease protease subunit
MYYQMTQKNDVATINIFGDITSFPWFEGDVSAANLSRQLDQMGDVNEINVYINSYGGEVAEGLAIYNALKRHKAKVKTYCTGFACSIASVIFMAGDERIMDEASLLMIHNAWSWAEGNADQLRKLAEDLEKITQASVTAYKAHSSLSEEEIKALMDAETWILPEEAMEYGFATAVEKTEQAHASQNAKMRLMDIVKASRPVETEVPETEPEAEPVAEVEPEIVEETEIVEEPEAAPEEVFEEKPEEEAAQKWSGFFNALMKNI